VILKSLKGSASGRSGRTLPGSKNFLYKFNQKISLDNQIISRFWRKFFQNSMVVPGNKDRRRGVYGLIFLTQFNMLETNQQSLYGRPMMKYRTSNIHVKPFINKV
jgi:hypothetical protein